MLGFILFVVVLAVIIVMYIDYSRQQAANAPPPAEPLAGPGEFDVGAVGESNYQRQLRAVGGAGEVRHECQAVLVLEDDNKFDKKAVRVDINNGTVGYLSREDARTFRKKRKGSEFRAFLVDAIIVGGGKGKPSLGVWLDISL